MIGFVIAIVNIWNVKSILIFQVSTDNCFRYSGRNVSSPCMEKYTVAFIKPSRRTLFSKRTLHELIDFSFSMNLSAEGVKNSKRKAIVPIILHNIYVIEKLLLLLYSLQDLVLKVYLSV